MFHNPFSIQLEPRITSKCFHASEEPSLKFRFSTVQLDFLPPLEFCACTQMTSTFSTSAGNTRFPVTVYTFLLLLVATYCLLVQHHSLQNPKI